MIESESRSKTSRNTYTYVALTGIESNGRSSSNTTGKFLAKRGETRGIYAYTVPNVDVKIQPPS